MTLCTCSPPQTHTCVMCDTMSAVTAFLWYIVGQNVGAHQSIIAHVSDEWPQSAELLLQSLFCQIMATAGMNRISPKSVGFKWPVVTQRSPLSCVKAGVIMTISMKWQKKLMEGSVYFTVLILNSSFSLPEDISAEIKIGMQPLYCSICCRPLDQCCFAWTVNFLLLNCVLPKI